MIYIKSGIDDASHTHEQLEMDLERQNWENFCRHHLGDWHGTWKRYGLDGVVTESFQCIRSFQLRGDGSEIEHQNHYLYADGRRESKSFGPYRKPNTRSLFLDRCFSWGTTQVDSGSKFGFETGFRWQARRVSVAAVYEAEGGWQSVVIITEHLDRFADELHRRPTSAPNRNWLGRQTTMSPDWVVTPAVMSPWQPLEELAPEELTLHFPESLSINLPRQIERLTSFAITVDWQVSPELLLRGIRQFKNSKFTQLGLAIFSPTP